jgi:serine/threonine protein kinase
MRYLGEREYHGSYSKQKSEVFSYGMLLLEMATFCRASAFYNFFSYIIDFKQLNLAISSLRSRYTPSLVDFVKSLLQENPNSRPSFAQIE